VRRRSLGRRHRLTVGCRRPHPYLIRHNRARTGHKHPPARATEDRPAPVKIRQRIQNHAASMADLRRGHLASIEDARSSA
jgi:hypothetical protein